MSQDKLTANTEGLVQIKGKAKDFDPSRRKFLKILGASSAVGIAACADPAAQKILPNIKGDSQQVPGVSVWFNSTCTECSAGCGISVRTREGRAVKIEGNAESPINKGGLCSLGHSALQSLYDPDRIRQPLKRTATVRGKPIFAPITWDEALTQVSEWVKDGKKKYFVSQALSGALEELVGDFSSKNGFERASFELLEASAVAKANELAFGTAGVPTYNFEKAKTIVNFGSDFMETWVSPCEFTRGWARGRKSSPMLRLVHIEPRLSLTGANADLWLSANPGSEVRLALALLKIVAERGSTDAVRDDVRSKISQLTKGVSVSAVSEECGVSPEKIALVAEYLLESSPSLVIAGGTAAATDQQLGLLTVCNLLNLVLGNIGKTVEIAKTRPVKSSLSRLASVIEGLNKGDADLLFIGEVNPVFTLPGAYGFMYAAKKAAHVVSFSSHLDDTASLADIILPSNHSLESWGDSRGVPGVYSLMQPTMRPVFDTRGFGDMLLDISDKAGKSIASASGKDFQSYLKDSWKKLQTSLGAQASGDFNKFWTASLERGGFFSDSSSSSGSVPQINAKAFEISFEPASFEHQGCAETDPVLYPYPSVKSFDGRAANRPWMQELADPVTQNLWDSWVEIHPETAKKYGVEKGDMVTLRNFFGEVDVPIYITPYVKPGLVAVPIGQGHQNYGRFASAVKGGNVLSLLPAIAASRNPGDGVPLLVTRVSVIRGRGRSTLVNAQEGWDSQLGRDLAQTSFITAGATAAHQSNGHGAGHHESTGHADGHGEGEHHAKQMYDQRPHPVYKWGLAVDLAACTGCGACVVACNAENNVAMVGKTRASEGREMAWIRIERYFDGTPEEMHVSFLPMMCQQCGNAPCEPVCPVYATYHNEEGLNSMIYNRCVGTRYCSNNCSYKVRRFNWFEYEVPYPLDMQMNPDVTRRTAGVMEKCTFCVQRIAEGKDRAKDLGRLVVDGEIQPACVQSCSAEAMVFGNLNDKNSKVSKLAAESRAYKILDHHLNTQPAITYLKNVKYKA